MKVGILTWWRNNYGSILQAYGLQYELTKYDGVQCEIICQFGKKSTSVDNFIDKLRNVGFFETFRRVFWKVALSGLRVRNRKMQEYVDEKLIVSDRQYTEDSISDSNKEYDIFICGSDQIWNPDLVSLDSMYWMGFTEAGKRKIAYAPSFGTKEVTMDQQQKIIANLESFTAISCRESSGSETINRIIGEERCQTVLDPTLLVEKEFWDNNSAERLFKEKYIFAYILRGTKKQRQLVEDFARVKKLKVVSIPFLDYEKIELYDLRFGDLKLWSADPAEFISAIRNAEYIFCDSFHCTVFSLLYHRPFYIFPKIGKDGNKKITQLSRMTDLLNTVGISNRIVHDEAKVLDDNNIDWQHVDEVLEYERKKSRTFLERALFE